MIFRKKTHVDNLIEKKLYFSEVQNNIFGIVYERFNVLSDCDQVVLITHEKRHGKPVIESYNKKTKEVCPLTFEEFHIFNKKIKQIERRWNHYENKNTF